MAIETVEGSLVRRIVVTCVVDGREQLDDDDDDVDEKHDDDHNDEGETTVGKRYGASCWKLSGIHVNSCIEMNFI